MSTAQTEVHVVRIVMVEDHAFTRDGLRAVLSTTPDLHLIAEFDSGEKALEYLGAREADVAIIDINLPGMDGIQTAQEVHRLHPHMHVMMLTASNRAEQVFAALASGAVAYCLKSSDVDVILQGIRAAAAGSVFLDPQSATHLLRSVHTAQPVRALDPREIQILRLIADGQTNKDIAERLNLSVATVKQLIQDILEKLQASDRTQAAVKALRAGLI